MWWLIQRNQGVVISPKNGMVIPKTKHSVHPTTVSGISTYTMTRTMIKGSQRNDLILATWAILNEMMPGRKLGKYRTTFILCNATLYQFPHDNCMCARASSADRA